MEVEREITLDAPPEEVWEALTEPERLEEWFANDVDFDLERGGTFRWGDGETRHAIVEEAVPERRLAIRWVGSRRARRRARSPSPSSRSRPGRGSSSPRRPHATGRGGIQAMAYAGKTQSSQRCLTRAAGTCSRALPSESRRR
jgi:hypothetical protein